jgi:hypothetical protein
VWSHGKQKLVNCYNLLHEADTPSIEPLNHRRGGGKPKTLKFVNFNRYRIKHINKGQNCQPRTGQGKVGETTHRTDDKQTKI